MMVDHCGELVNNAVSGSITEDLEILCKNVIMKLTYSPIVSLNQSASLITEMSERLYCINITSMCVVSSIQGFPVAFTSPLT